jgi:hypothetical protein
MLKHNILECVAKSECAANTLTQNVPLLKRGAFRIFTRLGSVYSQPLKNFKINSYALIEAQHRHTDEDRVRSGKYALRKDVETSITTVLFFIEIGPRSSRRGAKCQHVICRDCIDQSTYRVAIRPGMNGSAGEIVL